MDIDYGMDTYTEKPRKLRELSLFSGAGGGLLASQWLKSWRTVCYVEWDEYCQQVLQARIRDGFLHDAPIWDNVQTFDGRPWKGIVDVISAGFPCQPFSVAGKRKSSGDLRNGWPDTIRVIREVQPKFVFLENVRGLLSAMGTTQKDPVFYFGVILRDLAQSGYNAKWRVLSAAECGAPHQRDRLWIVGTNPRFINGEIQTERQLQSFFNEKRYGQKKIGKKNRIKPSMVQGEYGILENSWWIHKPKIPRMANGVADRMDRLKSIGNGQVPIVAATSWDLLIGDTK